MTELRVLPALAARGAVAAAAVLALTACGTPADDTSAPTTSTTPAAEEKGATAPEATASSEPEAAETDAPVATDPPASAPAPAPAPDTTGPAAADVVLSFAGWIDADSAIEAAGYVTPVVEDGGTCTLLLTSGDRQARATSSGVADASTTACGGLAVDGSELASGTWTAVLQYSSATAEGTSEPLDVEVP